jgi:hypothetical protein
VLKALIGYTVETFKFFALTMQDDSGDSSIPLPISFFRDWSLAVLLIMGSGHKIIIQRSKIQSLFLQMALLVIKRQELFQLL